MNATATAASLLAASRNFCRHHHSQKIAKSHLDSRTKQGASSLCESAVFKTKIHFKMSTWTILSSYISEPGGNICMSALSGLKTASEVVQCDLSWLYENRCCWLDGAHLAGGEETSRQEHWPKSEIFLLEYLVFLILFELNCNTSVVDFKHKLSCHLFGSMLKSQNQNTGKNICQYEWQDCFQNQRYSWLFGFLSWHSWIEEKLLC